MTCSADFLGDVEQDFSFIAVLSSEDVNVSISCTESRRRRLAASATCAGGGGPTLGFDMTVNVPVNGQGSSPLLRSGASGDAAAAVFRQYQSWEAASGSAVVCGPADVSEVKVLATQVRRPAWPNGQLLAGRSEGKLHGPQECESMAARKPAGRGVLRRPAQRSGR